MEKLELNEIIVSEYDNLEGLMCQIAKKRCLKVFDSMY